MLVLTRRVGEAVVVDGDVRITVLAVNGNKIRIGVAAPPHVRVDREEIHERRAQFDPEADRPQLCPAGLEAGRAVGAYKSG